MTVGSSQFVAVNVLAGQFVTTAARKTGSDAVVAVNGTKADATGNTLNINSATLQAQITLKATAAAGASAFYVTGGGALFQIGANTNITGQYNIGVQSINPGRLGGKAVGFLNQIVTGGTFSLANGGDATATSIVDQAISQVSTLRGRLGALQANTLNTNVNSLNVALENVTSANSNITDADFAAETANMTRAQILVSAGTSVLQTANTIPQSVLKLLQ
jgi:flagellin